MSLDPSSTLPGMAGDVLGGASQKPDPKTIMMTVAKLLSGTGGALQGSVPQGGGGSAARTPGPLPNPSLPVPQGSMMSQIPQLSQQPMPNANRVGADAGAQTGGGSFNFPTPKARNAAVVTNAIQGFSQLAASIHQKKFEEQVGEAESIYQAYLMKVKQLEAAKASGDPEQVKAAQQELQKYAQDKKVQKVLQTVSNPTKAMSPQSIGVQRAMKQAQEKAMQDAQLEAERNKAQAEQARAEQERATADLRRKQAEAVGQETPEQRSAQAAKHQDIQTVVDAMVKRQKDQITAMGERQQAQITSSEKLARNHDAMLERIAKIREGDKDVEHLTKEQAALTAQINSLNAESKAVIDGIAKNPNTSWLNGDKEKAAKQLQNIETRRAALEKQQKAIQDKWGAMYLAGKMPNPNEPPPPAAQAAPSEGGDVTDEQFKNLLDQLSQQPGNKGSQYQEQ